MQRAQRICYMVAAIVATWAVAGNAAAEDPQQQPPQQQQQPPQPSEPSQPSQPPQPPQPPAPVEVMAAMVSASATVEKVDVKKRQMMLKDAQGTRFKVNVPAEVTNLDTIKKGDKVAIDYYTSVALALKRGAKGEAPSAEETTRVERIPGPLPGGIVARKISATAEVVKVDQAANKVTIKAPTGELDTIHVSDPAVQADLAKLKKGDKIQASYAEAVAITVTPQKKQKS